MTPTSIKPELETPELPGFEDTDFFSDAVSEAVPEAPPSAEAAPQPVDEGVPAETGPVRVLIVDDESAMCMMTSAIVESMGYVPIVAGSGEEAVTTFRDRRDRNEAIQAVIMDLALPGGMSGLEATDALHEIDSEVKVIASSGYLQQNARIAAIERGFAGILPKPYTAERLTAELRWVVTHRAR